MTSVSETRDQSHDAKNLTDKQTSAALLETLHREPEAQRHLKTGTATESVCVTVVVQLRLGEVVNTALITDVYLCSDYQQRAGRPNEVICVCLLRSEQSC